MHSNKSSVDRRNLFYHLGLLSRRWRQILDHEFKSAGLTDATWRPLLHLHILGDGIRQKELAASVGIEGPSLVRLLDTLTAKGLMLRSDDAKDGRAKLLRLTPEGRSVVSRINETLTSLENGLLSPFSDDEISRLGQFVLRLESSVDDARRRMKG